MAIGIAAGIAGAGLLGDIFSSAGQQSTNAANIQEAQMQDTFNAGQAQLNRDWMTQSQQSAEAYNTMMSDTSMQRRVADLKAAGLNPMLATGIGGASTPQMSGQSGSTASSAGLPNIQNPNAAFANAGQIAASAVQASQIPSQIQANQSQAGLADAQADKAAADAGYTRGAQTDLAQQQVRESQGRVDYMVAQGDQAKAAAALDRQQVVESNSRIDKINADIAALSHVNNLNDATARLRMLDGDLQDLNVNQFAYLSPEIVKQAIATSNTMQMNAGMLAKAFATYQGATGSASAYMDRIANWFHLGVNLSQFGK